jgi:heme-degrading monooxygenase HmoA
VNKEATMYGTILHVRLKAGAESKLLDLMDEFVARRVPGFVTHYVYRLDRDSNETMTAVVFESKEAYVANANSPEQNDMYQRMVELFDGEPTWYDGEIIYPG